MKVSIVSEIDSLFQKFKTLPEAVILPDCSDPLSDMEFRKFIIKKVRSFNVNISRFIKHNPDFELGTTPIAFVSFAADHTGSFHDTLCFALAFKGVTDPTARGFNAYFGSIYKNPIGKCTELIQRFGYAGPATHQEKKIASLSDSSQSDHDRSLQRGKPSPSKLDPIEPPEPYV